MKVYNFSLQNAKNLTLELANALTKCAVENYDKIVFEKRRLVGDF